MALGITKGLQTWLFQESHVERNMDNAAYTSANADDTLLLVGPSRLSSVNPAATDGVGSLLAMGLTQSFSYNQSLPSQPIMAIGSGRQFYVSGKAGGSWNMSRILSNGRNILRLLYHNAVAAGIDVSAFDDRPALSTQDHFYTNLDSELYKVPFGLAVICESKAHDQIMSVYLENCMINSYGTGFSAGQGMVAETVNGAFDRVVKFLPTEIVTAPNGGVARADVDTLLGLVDNLSSNGQGLADNITSNAP